MTDMNKKIEFLYNETVVYGKKLSPIDSVSYMKHSYLEDITCWALNQNIINCSANKAKWLQQNIVLNWN